MLKHDANLKKFQHYEALHAVRRAYYTPVHHVCMWHSCVQCGVSFLEPYFLVPLTSGATPQQCVGGGQCCLRGRGRRATRAHSDRLLEAWIGAWIGCGLGVDWRGLAWIGVLWATVGQRERLENVERQPLAAHEAAGRTYDLYNILGGLPLLTGC